MADYFDRLKDSIRRTAERVAGEGDDWIAASGVVHGYRRITRIDVRTGDESSAGASFADDATITREVADAAVENMRGFKGADSAALLAVALETVVG